MFQFPQVSINKWLQVLAMLTKCDQCGQPSYVKYVKLNPGIICDKCEDAERKRKGVDDIWETIKNKTRQFSGLT
jgi:formylmethanofuran dehydrogenase subunit E